MDSPRFWRLLLLITVLYSLPFGLIFLVAPAWGLGLLGLSTNGVGQLIARYFAAFALGAAVLAWVMRQRSPERPDFATSLSLLVAFGATLVVSILGLIQGLLAPPIGWLVAAFDVFFTLGYGYFAVTSANVKR